jgi:predicted ribosomally synthesized peptide with SipW-like signal peptide
MSKKTKRYLMLLVAVGLIAVAAGGSGTFATFNAQTSNTGNYFATGTLFLHNTANGTTCTSESEPLNNANITSPTGCNVLFTVNPLLENSVSTAQLKLTNAGSINAQDIQFSLGAAGCTEAPPTIATLNTAISNTAPITSLDLINMTQTLVSGTKIVLTDTAGSQTLLVTTTTAPVAGAATVLVTIVGGGNATHNYTTATSKVTIAATFGTPSLCTDMLVNVQETAANFSTNQGCAYGVAAGLACTLNATKTLGGIGTSYVPLLLATTGGDGNGAARLDAAGSRYFVISVKAPTIFSNAYQNDKVSFDLKWKIDQ